MAKKLDAVSKTKVSAPAPSDASKDTAKPQTVEVVAPAKAAAPSEPVAAPQEGETVAPAAKPAGDDYDELFPEPSVSITRPPAWLLWALLVVSFLILAAIGYKVANGKLDTWLGVSTPTPSADATATPTVDPNATATPTTSPESTETPTPSPSSTPTTTPTPTPSATPTPPTNTVKPSSVTLRVLNGTTKNGAAASAKTKLEQAGFTVRSIGNAKQQNYATTIVYYQAGRQAEAQAVADSLTGYSVSLEQSTLASPDMVLVVTGAK